MSAGVAIILWVISLLATKAAQIWLFPNYRKTWNKWDRIRNPAGLKMIRYHPFHTLGWYVVAALLAVFFFSLIGV